VNLLRCHILGFGRLVNLPVSFARGLNIVCAANEAGKSTLQRFVVALLYGQLRPDIKTQRRLDAWVEAFKPWRAADYGGTLWCELANGRELEIHRMFGRDDSKVEIRTVGGEDITREYQAQRNGDVVFAASHLALTKELFESVAVIREDETAMLRHRETLRDRIANLAQSGDEKLSVRLSLVKLEEALEAIGSERAPTRPLRQALDRLQELRQEKEELDAQRQQCQAWIQEKMLLAGVIDGLERDRLAASRGVIDARWREARLRVRTLEEIDEDLRGMDQEVGALGANPDFPRHRLEDLNRLAAGLEHAERRLEEIRSQKKEAQLRHDQLGLELGKLAAYGAVQEGAEPEQITEWFVNYLSLSRQRDEVLRSLNHQLDEAAGLMRWMDDLSPVVRDSGIDWERKARQAAEEERTASQQSMVLADRAAQAGAEHARIAGKARRRMGLAAAALGVALAAVAAGIAVAGLPPALWVAIAGGAGALGLTLLLAASRSRGAAAQAMQSCEALEAGLRRLHDQGQAAQGDFQKAVADSGFPTAEEFLDAARQAEWNRQRLEDLAPRIREAEQQRDRLQISADEVYARLKECLNRAGLQCAPGNVKTPVDTLRANMRRYAETSAAHKRQTRDVKALQADEENVAAQVGQINARIREILAEGGADSVEAFRSACQKSLRLLDLRSKAASRTREFERLRGALTLDQWKSRLSELQRLRGGNAEENAVEDEKPGKLSCLPYLPTVEETEQEEKRVTALLAQKREQHAGVSERILQAFHNYRTPSEIEEDLNLAEQEVQELTLNRKALALALDSIRSLARLQQEVCAPQLNRAVEDRFLQICPERYEEVKVDPDFRVQVREKETAELRSAENLSRGAQDQLYFTMRFAILDLLGNSQEPCPCLLDEPFVAYDSERMNAAFRILEQEAARRQMILFTCRDDVRARALEHGAHLISL